LTQFGEVLKVQNMGLDAISSYWRVVITSLWLE